MEAGRQQGKSWRTLLTVGATGLVLGAVAVLGLHALDDESGSAAQPFQARIPPAEFLYLDGPRILNYLAQLEGGSSKQIHRISKEVRTVSGEVDLAQVKGGASSQREDSAEITLTRTAASSLGLLLHDLKQNTRHGVQMHSVELQGPKKLEDIEEGWLVRFVTNDLLSPGYIRPYVVVRQSATLAALFARSAGDDSDPERWKEEKELAESFSDQVGPNPRITFAVAPSSSDGEDLALKLLLPMRYRFLTEERSLLEKGADEYTGGRLVVIGKVIRVFDGVDECANEPCPEGAEYVDWATREIWEGPLKQASDYLISNVSRNCRTKASAMGEAGLGNPGNATGRDCFLAKLRRQTEVDGRGAVILPIAVYK